MADIANVVATFLTLATDWYKSAAARNTASATLNNHLRNFAQYHAHILDPIESLFKLDRRRRQNPLVLFQAARVVHLDASLQEWLDEAGFRKVRQDVKVIVARRSRSPHYSREYFVERRRSHKGQLRLPRFGVTTKEVAFITLFERLREAYEKLEAVYPEDAYRGIRRTHAPRVRHMNFRPTGMRGGYNSDVDTEPGDAYRPPDPFDSQFASGIDPEPIRQDMPPTLNAQPFYNDFDPFREQPFRLTKRQKLRQELMLQDLSEKLERNIASMMIANGDEKELRQRRRERRPLEDARRVVLQEKVRQAKVAERQQLERETRRTQSKATTLRDSKHYKASTDLDDLATDSEDEIDDIHHVRPFPYDHIIVEPGRNPNEGYLGHVIDIPGPHARPVPEGNVYNPSQGEDFGPDAMPGVPGGYVHDLPHGEDIPPRPPQPAHVSSYNSQASENEGRHIPADITVDQGPSLSQLPPRTPTEVQLDAERKRLQEERRRMTAERELCQQERHLLHQQRQTIETERLQLAAERERLREEARQHERQRRRHTTHEQHHEDMPESHRRTTTGARGDSQRYEEISEWQEQEASVGRRHISPHGRRQNNTTSVYRADTQVHREDYKEKRKPHRQSRSMPIRFSLVRPLDQR